MKINVNHPSFMSFLTSTTNHILSAININEYFTLTNEKKLAVLFTVLSLIKNRTKVISKLSDAELNQVITLFRKKNEESENYEFAAILNDVLKNFDVINNLSTQEKNPKKTIRKKETK